MSYVDEPIIEHTGPEALDYTCVTFRPDLSKFGITGLDDDTVAMMTRRTVDIAGTLEGVNVYLNGTKLDVRFGYFYISHCDRW